jgi:glycosyltransferase involved in cell wall biosynthesis
MSESLHVLQIGLHPPPYGGVAIHLYRLKQFLEANGVRCSILDWSGVHDPAKSTDRDIYVVGGRSMVRGLKLVSFAARLKPDVLHIHVSSGSKFVWLGLPLIFLCSGQKFVTVHNSSLVSQTRLWHRPLLLRILKAMDQIIAVNVSLQRALRSFTGMRVPIEVIPAYIRPCATELAAPDTHIVSMIREQRSRFGKIVVIAGFMNSEYGFDIALQAMQKLYDESLGLVMVSYGAENAEYSERVRKMAQALDGRVVWLRDLSPPAFLYLLSQADVFLRPRDLDGDSIAVREALSFGKVVLASDGVPRPEGVKLFQLDDLSSLVDSLRGLAHKEGPIAEVSHQPDPFAQQILDLYNRCFQ